MATATIAPFDGTLDNGNIQNPLRGTISQDILTGGVSVATGATLEIQCESNDDLIIVMVGSAASVVTLEAGDYPPSPHADAGSKAYTVPVGDVLILVPEAGRHIKNLGGLAAAAGSIIATVSGTGPVLFWVFRLPAGLIGIGQMNRTTIPAAPA